MSSSIALEATLARPRRSAGGASRAPGERADSDAALGSATPGWYVCAACAERLAREDWALEAHPRGPLVFTNPHGRFFELLLVTHVLGGVFDRHATTEFSWFAGYAWRIGSCARCGAHIGWHFQATHEASLREFVALSRAALKFSRSE